jgi:ubiquinone/menaquinone biosynthesis C-methylase UbiE
MPAIPSGPRFDGAVPGVYEKYLVPLIFEPFARDLAARVARDRPARVLELAAGTGALTRELARVLPADAKIVATDLSPAMLDVARSRGTCRPVQWAPADALQLPFNDGAFDAVACQFGAMFFPDHTHGFAEAHRVLAPSGRFVFNVWGRLEDNDFAAVVMHALGALFPHDPPTFLARIPHACADPEPLRRELAAAGFDDVAIERVDLRSHAASPRDVAIAFCHGTPLREEILERDAGALDRATDMSTTALARRFGAGPIDGRISALVAIATRG